MILEGDCLAVMPTLQSVDCIITDPPYGISYLSGYQTQNNRSPGAVGRRSMPFFDRIHGDESLPLRWIPLAYSVLKDSSAIYVYAHWKNWGTLSKNLTSAGFKVKNMIVLNKSNWGMGDLKGSYAPKHELLCYAVKGKHKLNVPPRLSDVWDVPVLYSGSTRLHPNQKRLEWITPAILQSTQPGDTILDPFAGSGSTGEACVATGRKFILIERDPKYVQVCRDRLAC